MDVPGHLKNFPNEYQAAVKSFLNKRSTNNTFRSLESSGLRGGGEETTTTGIIAQSGHHQSGDSKFHRSRFSQGFSIGDTSYDTKPSVQHDDARTTKNSYTSKSVSLGDSSNPLNRPLISRLWWSLSPQLWVFLPWLVTCHIQLLTMYRENWHYSFIPCERNLTSVNSLRLWGKPSDWSLKKLWIGTVILLPAHGISSS